LKNLRVDVLKKLKDLKIDKSPGLDMLHPRILQEFSDILAKPLHKIFKKSLLSRDIPSDWKKSEVITLHKKGPLSERGNYRPVSLTNVCCKVMESLIPDHIIILCLIFWTASS
jgi:hypothetical protein